MGKANGSLERAPDDRLRMTTIYHPHDHHLSAVTLNGGHAAL